MSEIKTLEANTQQIINKGTGAGGSNTNYYGKLFEEKTNNEKRLLGDGYEKTILNKKVRTDIICQRHLKIKQLLLFLNQD